MKKINLPTSICEKQAEMLGIIFGDGGLYLDRKNKYQTSVAFHKEEFQYLEYVRELFSEIFIEYKFCISELKDEYLLRNNSVAVGEHLLKLGMKHGNKVKNKLKVPKWIFSDELFTISFLRGFFDTDGCVYKKYDHYAQIQFKLGCKETLESIKELLELLGYNPTTIQEETHSSGCSWKIYLSRQQEISAFFDQIQPRNKKHLDRYIKIKMGPLGISSRAIGP